MIRQTTIRKRNVFALLKNDHVSIIALADPSLVPFAGAATAQIAFGVVLTSIVTPIITQWYAKKKGLAKPKVAAEKS
jgi:hypothetical protein